MSRQPVRRSPPRRPGAPKRRKTSLGDRLIARLPVSHDTLRRAVTWSFLGLGGAVAIAAATWLGVPGMVGDAVAEGAGRAGLRVEQVDITGLKRMDRETVYAIALENQTAERPLLAVDLEAVRKRLLAYGWIADAYVSRRFPDRLLIHIVEREPAAIWQNEGQLTLIDATGTLLDPVDPNHMPPGLPLMIGPGAAQQEDGYQKLLAAAPALRPRVKAATWVGNRRWDLTFDTGETLLLPQDGAAQALVRFAEMEGAKPLLGKGWVRFDMRDPTKLVARKPGPESNRADAEPGENGGGTTSEMRVARVGDV
ncbi:MULTISPECIES: cell division protein FtsQ/DivIB [unclassified Sphingomonas]|uniref:cell division protein FtsQ/DivIB n=1 Tax=unclassified Sphingomonas TaxID=196159 RepID=UPI000A8F83D4|nr:MULTISPECIES: cell division protein FtsQ/DivIB [unclassified Sphingomonas]MBN8849182.1 FtsQ-type POTRA domain-containing protein [Sphingomonas sp.]